MKALLKENGFDFTEVENEKYQWTWINHVTQRFVESGAGLMFSFYQFACVTRKQIHKITY